MSPTYVQILGLGLAMLVMGCAASTPRAGRFADTEPPLNTVELTCTAVTERSRGDGVRGGQTARYSCDRAKGPDGTEVEVRVIDSRVGHKLSCTDKEGKITCPSVPLAAYTRPTPWFFPSPSTFPPFTGTP